VAGSGLKFGGLAVVIAAVFGGAYGIGQLVGPVTDEPAPAATHDGMAAADEGHGGGHAEAVPKGLQVSQDGMTLDVLSEGLSAGQPADFAFRILGADGHAVTSYTETHDKLMHLIVVRRDLSGFQHVHPDLADDGTWRIPLTFAAAGDYRVFADFEARGEEGLTLGADVPVAGPYTPVPLPPPALTSTVGEYRVTLSGDLTPGATSKLTLTVDRDGVPVTDLQPYLGAYGHLVALRQGDLAYLHVHPEESKRAGPNIVFYAEVPSAGTYRLYLDFKHGDVVRTVEFTVAAGEHGHG
jgi:hypothetical protein